jgi:acetyltransferase-like isoleucine patch superfamily enzyme
VPIESSEPRTIPPDLAPVGDSADGAPRLTGQRSLRHAVINRLRGYATPEWLVKRGLQLGKDVYLGAVHFDYGFLGLITIGDEAVITDGVRIVAHDASIKHWTGYSRVGRVDIGRRVYVGVGAILLPGVHVGDDAIVGAGGGFGDAPPRPRLEGRPHYPREGFVGPEAVPTENIERMRRELADGDGLVE